MVVRTGKDSRLAELSSPRGRYMRARRTLTIVPTPYTYRNLGVSAETAPFIKRALADGYYQHVIAAYLNDNQGRVSETKTGKRYPDVRPADSLPADFPLAA